MPVDPLLASSLIMGGASLLQGAIQGGKARKMRDQYDKTMQGIPMQDPGIVSYLGDARRRRAAFDAGTDPMTSYTKQQIMENAAQTQLNATRTGRGGLSDLMRIQANADRSLGAAGAGAARYGANLFALEGDLAGAMAQRAYNRQLADANRQWSEYARLKEDSGRSIQAGLGMALIPLMFRAATRTPVEWLSASPVLSDILGNANNYKGYSNSPY